MWVPFCAQNEPCTDARYAGRELAPGDSNIEASVYGEAATSTGAKRTERSAWLGSGANKEKREEYTL